MKKWLLLMVGTLISSPAYSSNYVGLVEAVRVGPVNGDIVTIRMQGTISGKPLCSNNPYYDFALDLSGPGGKETFSVLLSAYHMKTSISIEGFNTCNIMSNVEDLKQLALQ